MEMGVFSESGRNRVGNWIKTRSLAYRESSFSGARREASILKNMIAHIFQLCPLL